MSEDVKAYTINDPKFGKIYCREGENFMIATNSPSGLEAPFKALQCYDCKRDFEMWSNSKVDLLSIAYDAGWKRLKRNRETIGWICPTCKELSKFESEELVAELERRKQRSHD